MPRAFEPKSVRQQHQRARLADLLRADDAAAALFAHWPNRLPAAVKNAIPAEAKRGWQARRSERAVQRDEALVARLEKEDLDLQVHRATQNPHVATHAALIDAVLTAVRQLPGPRVLTVNAAKLGSKKSGYAPHPHLFQTISFLIDEKNQFEHAGRLEPIARALLATALTGSGSLVLRQELKLRVQAPDPTGKMVWNPQKNLYGFHLGQGRIVPLSPAGLQESFSIDHRSGARLAPEPGVHFKALSPRAFRLARPALIN